MALCLDIFIPAMGLKGKWLRWNGVEKGGPGGRCGTLKALHKSDAPLTFNKAKKKELTQLLTLVGQTCGWIIHCCMYSLNPVRLSLNCDIQYSHSLWAIFHSDPIHSLSHGFPMNLKPLREQHRSTTHHQSWQTDIEFQQLQQDSDHYMVYRLIVCQACYLDGSK
jgi:hypothetical protein